MKRSTRSAKRTSRSPHWLMARPNPDDFIQLLRAWRFWIAAGLLGALLAAAVYVVAPPSYRASATVLVDFHLEQAWPQNTDREQFYYLERETRKLIEIAWADQTLSLVTTAFPDLDLDDLRGGKLSLSQPGSGGWHFLAEDSDPARAALLASTWARAFAGEVLPSVSTGPAGGLEPYITADVVQADNIPVGRIHSAGAFMALGAVIALSLGAAAFLFIRVAE